MTSDNPQQPPTRKIEIVPLDAPATPFADERPARPFFIVEPVPEWRAPAVRTTTHTARKPQPFIDLRDSSTAQAMSEPTSEARIRAALLRERRALRVELGITRAITPRADTTMAPFPLPTPPAPPMAATPAATRLRRVPKTPSADGHGRPLASDVAAAIARVTGLPTPTEAPASGPSIVALPTPSEPVAEASNPRRRLEIVPLDAPTAPVIDLREHTPGARREESRAARHCPACNTPGMVDVIDNVTGDVHLNCPQCFRMWREKLNSQEPTSNPRG